MSRVAVLGAGAFGTALARAFTGEVVLWGRGDDLDVALDGAGVAVLAIPAQALGAFVREHAARLEGRALVSCAKGIDLATLAGPSQALAAACPRSAVAVLTGPSFAADIGRGLPTALTLACRDAEAGAALQARLSTPVLRLYRSDDVTGAELGGALKNVIAIAAGAAIGAGLGDSARAAIVTRGFAEMTRLAVALGGRVETLAGLSGLGDLMLTATSPQSRNFRYGAALGAGEAFDPRVTVEGAATARAVAALAPQVGVAAPVAAEIAALVEGRTTLPAAMERLLARPLTTEHPEDRRCRSTP